MHLSIIVPAYNSACYLPRCIESLVAQGLPTDSYEVIVVNDGSTDDTESLLEQFTQTYSFLRFITTENGGLSRARNRGLKEAQGEFVLFVDSDDAIAPYTLYHIYREMSESQLDMMLLNYLHISSNHTYLDIPFDMDQNTRQIVSGKDFLLADHYPPMVWAYAYRRSFLQEHQLEMKPIGHEDEEFTPRALYHARRIKYYPLLYYYYYMNTSSYMENYKEQNFLYMIEAMGSLDRFRKECPEKEVQNYFSHRIARTLLMLFKKSFRMKFTHQERMIQAVQQEKLLPLSPPHSSFYYFLFNLSPAWFCKYYGHRKKSR